MECLSNNWDFIKSILILINQAFEEDKRFQ
jgi:hypothetical protein